uniref:Putative transposase n=1 Tax=Caulobacter sp. (strain K31) TaxID=366602 RepID=B0T9Y2_CAUSK
MRLYDDRLDVYLGASLQMTMPRGRARPNGKHGHVVDYRHVIHSLKRKPMALLGLVYRDKLFPRQAYSRAFEAMVAKLPARTACRNMVDLLALALAHDRACEGELAERITLDLDGGRLPDMKVLRALFMPDIAALPEIIVSYTSLSLYDELATVFTGVAA